MKPRDFYFSAAIGLVLSIYILLAVVLYSCGDETTSINNNPSSTATSEQSESAPQENLVRILSNYLSQESDCINYVEIYENYSNELRNSPETSEQITANMQAEMDAEQYPTFDTDDTEDGRKR